MLRGTRGMKRSGRKRKHEGFTDGTMEQRGLSKLRKKYVKTKHEPERRVLGESARLQEERLEKLVLGDGSDVLRNLEAAEAQWDMSEGDSGVEEGGSELFEEGREVSPDSAMSPDRERSDEERHPAWVDDDDASICVKDAMDLSGRKAPMAGTSSDQYSKVLKKKFKEIMGTPKWARLGAKPKADSDSGDEDESESELLQHCGNFLVSKSTVLHKGTLEIRKLHDLNCETYSEGAVIKAAEFHPSSTVSLVAGLSGVASIFQVDGRRNTKLQSVQFERFPIRCARFTRDGDQFIVGSQHHGHYFCYDMMAGKIIRVPWNEGLEQTNMKKFEVSPDGRLLAVCGRFGNIYLLTSRTKEWVGTLKMSGEVKAIAFNSDGSRMFSHGDSGEVYVWDMHSRSCVHKFIDDGCIVGTSIALSPNQQYLACGSQSGVVNLYDTSALTSHSSPHPLKILLNLVTPVSSLKFNAASEILAMASDEKDNAVKLVHFPSMTVFSNFPGLQTNLLRPQCVDFSLNSGYFSLGNNRGSACLFRLKHYGNY